VLTILIVVAFSIVLSIVLTPLSDELASFLSGVIGNTLTVPFLALVWTLVYYRLAGERADAEPEPATL
jgi:hypothetical protein